MNNRKPVYIVILVSILLFTLAIIAAVFNNQKPQITNDTNVSSNDDDGDGINNEDDLCPSQAGPLSLGGCPAATATPTPTATNNPTSTPTVTYSIDGPTIKPTNTHAVTDTTQPSVTPITTGTIEPTSTTPTVTLTDMGQSSSTSGSNMIAILCGLSILFMLLAVIFFVRRKKDKDAKIVEKPTV